MFYHDGLPYQVSHQLFVNSVKFMESTSAVISEDRKYNTNYNGGVVFLNSTATVSIQTPFSNHYFMNPSSSYFGAFLLHAAVPWPTDNVFECFVDSPCLKRWCKLGSCQYSLHKVLWYSKVFVLYCLHFSITDFLQERKFTAMQVHFWYCWLDDGISVPLIWLVGFLELMEVCQSLNSARCDTMFYIILLNTFLKRKKAQPIVLNWWVKVRKGWTSPKGMQMVKFQEHEPSL